MQLCIKTHSVLGIIYQPLCISCVSLSPVWLIQAFSVNISFHSNFYRKSYVFHKVAENICRFIKYLFLAKQELSSIELSLVVRHVNSVCLEYIFKSIFPKLLINSLQLCVMNTYLQACIVCCC